MDGDRGQFSILPYWLYSDARIFKKKKFMDMLKGVPNDLMQWIIDYDQKYLSQSPMLSCNKTLDDESDKTGHFMPHSIFMKMQI